MAVFSLTVLFVLLSDAESDQVFERSLVFCFGYFGVGVSWVQVSIHQFGLPVFAFSAAMTVAFVLVVSLVPALMLWFARRYIPCPRRLFLLILLPATWVLSEWVRSWLFTGFPWLALGYSQIDSPLGGVATVLGTYGVSAVISVIAGALALFWIEKRNATKLSLSILTPILLISFWLSFVSWTSPKGEPFNVAIVQGNVAQALKWEPEQRQKTLDLYWNLSEPLWDDVDVIIWPETALPAFAHDLQEYLDAVNAQANQTQTDILIGLPVANAKTGEYFNSLISFGPREDGEMDIYHKRHLVPFGEYLPLKKWLDPILVFLKIPMSNFSRGESEQALISSSRHQIGVSICYEDVFGEEVISAMPQADFLVNVSNDAWFGNSLAPHQHLEMARMRALETGRFLVRSTNTGISAVIDPKGNVIDRIPQFETNTLVSTIQAYSGTTPYAFLGNWPVVIFTFASLVLLALRTKFLARGENA